MKKTQVVAQIHQRNSLTITVGIKGYQMKNFRKKIYFILTYQFLDDFHLFQFRHFKDDNWGTDEATACAGDLGSTDCGITSSGFPFVSTVFVTLMMSKEKE